MDFLNSLFSAIGPALGNLFGGGGQGGGNSAPRGIGGGNSTYGSANVPSGMGSYAQPTQSGAGGFLNNIFPGSPAAGLTGLGIQGIGSLLSPKLKAPDFNGMQSVQNLQNWGNSASHPLDPNVEQSIQNSANIQNEQQLRNLRDVYKNARPGTDYTTDSAYQRDLANLNRNMQMNTADAMAGAQFKSNEQNLGNMTNLANLDAGKSMMEYEQKAGEKENFNKGFGDLGSMFLQKGVGQPDYSKLFSMFQGAK